jgi:hypothetical protein
MQGGYSKEYLESKRLAAEQAKYTQREAFYKSVETGVEKLGVAAKVAGGVGFVAGAAVGTANLMFREGSIQSLRHAAAVGKAAGAELLSPNRVNLIEKVQKTPEFADWKKAQSAQADADSAYKRALSKF